MTCNLPPRVVRHRGLSIIELTVVITILLTLISILFIGSRAWKRGSDRSRCVLTMRNVQVATRSYQNMYGYNYGGRPYADNGTQDIAAHLYAKGYIEQRLFQQASGIVPCPSGGSYEIPLPDIFPAQGELFMTCSLAETEEHLPTAHADW